MSVTRKESTEAAFFLCWGRDWCTSASSLFLRGQVRPSVGWSVGWSVTQTFAMRRTADFDVFLHYYVSPFMPHHIHVYSFIHSFIYSFIHQKRLFTIS